MEGVQKSRVKDFKTALPPGSFSGLECEAAPDPLRFRSFPHRPAVIAGVDLCQREVAPANHHRPLAGVVHAGKQD